MKRKILGFGSAVVFTLAVVGCSKKPQQTAEKPAAPAASAAKVDLATAGTITGTVKLIGKAPRMRIIRMGADPACEKNNKGPVRSQQVVVGKDNGLQNVVVYIKSGLGNYSYPTPTQAATLDQKGCMYHPHIVTLMTNQKFEVINSDPLTHNIHVMPKINRQWNESQPQGAPPIVKEFPRAEMAIPVQCNIHPWMRAYVFVFKDPYFAKTDDDGSFTIKNVPPGTYTVEAWQEKYGTTDQQVTVGAKETKTVNFSFKSN